MQYIGVGKVPKMKLTGQCSVMPDPPFQALLYLQLMLIYSQKALESHSLEIKNL